MRRYLNGLIQVGFLGAAIVFIARVLLEHWQDVKALELQPQAWVYGTVALGVAILAQVIESLVWGWLLADMQQSVPTRWSMITFIKYVPAKYIPGNIWHMYGRVIAAQRQGLSLEPTTLSVMLEPLFVIAGALGWALLQPTHPAVEIPVLCLILLVVHPQVLNYLWHRFRELQGKAVDQIGMTSYPFRPLIGATLFMGLRGVIFLCVVLAFAPISWALLAPLVSGFSLAWLLRMVIPTPAGLGVFEAATVAALDGYLSPALLLGAVTLFRLIVVIAELLCAGCAYIVGPGPNRKILGWFEILGLPLRLRLSTLRSRVGVSQS